MCFLYVLSEVGRDSWVCNCSYVIAVRGKPMMPFISSSPFPHHLRAVTNSRCSRGPLVRNYFCALARSGHRTSDPIRFLTGYHKMQLNEALSVLSYAFWMYLFLFYRSHFHYVMLFLYSVCVSSLGCYGLVVNTSASDWPTWPTVCWCVDGDIESHSVTHSICAQTNFSYS